MRWAYLSFVKELNVDDNDHKTIRNARAGDTGTSNTVLYMIGDSYSYAIADTAFSGLCGYNYYNRYFDNYCHPDPKKKNILVIEVSERFIRDFFSDYRLYDHLKDSTIKEVSVIRLQQSICYAGLLPQFSMDSLFNKNINQNLEFNLFNYQFMSPVFELKAALNYYLFQRTLNAGVVISKDKKYLFFGPTLSSSFNTSSYFPLQSGEGRNIVNHLNGIYDHYKEMGFAEVYVSIIPNPCTIIQPAGYNNLIPDLQQDSALRMKTLDVYSRFKNTQADVYKHADTHWNMTGKQLWINMINEMIASNNHGSSE